MTIFDTIRYPLSEPPTFKQLKTLPRSTYDEWIRKIYGEVVISDTIQIFYMATTLMQLYRFDDDLYHRRMKLLRRLIKDYDNL